MEAIQNQPFNPKLTDDQVVRRLSFRDPAGSVFSTPRGLIRTVTPKAGSELVQTLSLRTVQKWVNSGRLISTEPIGHLEFRHPEVFFPTYPHEWCPEMLFAVG